MAYNNTNTATMPPNNGLGHNGVGHDGTTLPHNNGATTYNDGPMTGTHNNGLGHNNGVTPTTKKDQTGLLTRFLPERLKHGKFYRLLLRLTRILQFLSAVISLGLFSQRVYKVYHLVNNIKTRRGINGSYGAVEGILAAAVLYTILATLFQFILKGGGPRWLRWLWVLLDMAFVGGFIAVSVLTSPNGGMAGPKHCYDNRDARDSNNFTGQQASKDESCNLPWGTFILAIVST